MPWDLLSESLQITVFAVPIILVQFALEITVFAVPIILVQFALEFTVFAVPIILVQFALEFTVFAVPIILVQFALEFTVFAVPIILVQFALEFTVFAVPVILAQFTLEFAVHAHDISSVCTGIYRPCSVGVVGVVGMGWGGIKVGLGWGGDEKAECDWGQKLIASECWLRVAHGNGGSIPTWRDDVAARLSFLQLYHRGGKCETRMMLAL